MKKFLSLFLFATFFSVALYATHNRAGEITFSHISGLKYRVMIVTYTKESAPADRPALELFWGDGTSDSLWRSNGPGNMGEIIAPDIKMNIYIGEHTYPGTSSYIVFFEDPNRNGGVINIPGSVNVPFYVESQLTISSLLGYNNSVILLQPPIDDGMMGVPFIHNPNAYDPDGDSLSYELIQCKGAGGAPVPGYVFPIASNSLTLDAVTGDLIWDSPVAQGEYNVAFYIKEWRNGNLIGFVERDMQITIYPPSNNHPPAINNIANICVEAGTPVDFNVTATDLDNDVITLTATGAPFLFNPDSAEFPIATGAGVVTGAFHWNTTCSHVRKASYQVTFKAEDNNLQVHLVDLQSVQITVVAPSPKNPTATALGSSIILGWDQEICPQASGYYVYRRLGSYPYTIIPCVTGIPPFAGYVKIGTVTGATNTTFTDNNNGAGLVPGVDYCYRIVAFFPDGALSYTSEEVCTHLKKDIPVITNVSVNTTDATSGLMYVAWSKPTELDTGQFPGPYEYRLFRSPGFTGSSLAFVTSFPDLNDTTYTDGGLNTVGGPYSYVVELHNAGNGFIGKTQVASSIFLTIAPSDHALNLSWQETAPWNNTTYTVYRQNGSVWDSIGFSTTRSYTDAGLVNGQQYCYYVHSMGGYSTPGFVDPIINLSQQTCAIPIDNVPPCVTSLDTADFDCSSTEILFKWVKPDNACSSDLDHYNIYYSPKEGEPFVLYATVSDPNTTVYLYENIQSIAGCFYLTAVDTNNNESGHLNEICVDNCPLYELPNIFTPNGDSFNNELIPIHNRFVKDIELVIFNRWGQRVFFTTNPEVHWDGRVDNTQSMCPDGVYYYICKVNEIFRGGIRQRILPPGFIHLITDKNELAK